MKRFVRLLFGLFLFAVGIVFTMKANMGYAPWEVFHAGVGLTIGMTIGNVSIITGILIGVLVVLLGEKLGLGTVLNMVLIGIFMDIMLGMNLVPKIENIYLKLPMFLLGILIISFGSYYYIGSGFGAGPRDSLMVALTRKTKLPIGVCRGIVELSAVIAGYFLGGMVGLGTLIFVLGISFFVQSVFRFLHFDATKIKHDTLTDTWNQIRNFGRKAA